MNIKVYTILTSLILGTNAFAGTTKFCADLPKGLKAPRIVSELTINLNAEGAEESAQLKSNFSGPSDDTAKIESIYDDKEMVERINADTKGNLKLVSIKHYHLSGGNSVVVTKTTSKGDFLEFRTSGKSRYFLGSSNKCK